MAFLRIIEVFPPYFRPGNSRGERIRLEERKERFIEDVRSIRSLADVILVANLKDPGILKLSSVEASSLLQERLRISSAPVLVARDENKPQFLSTILTAISLELNSIMIAWGDEYPAEVGVTNARDFLSLSAALAEANKIKLMTRSSIELLAPVDVGQIAHPRGAAMAKRRLKAGAAYLLAQPPTTDSAEAFDYHASVLARSGLKDKVLLNVFPFRGEGDIKDCETYFGWKLPKSLHESAKAGEAALTREERRVVQRLRTEGYPGVYLSTRGNPRIAERLLA